MAENLSRLQFPIPAKFSSRARRKSASPRLLLHDALIPTPPSSPQESRVPWFILFLFVFSKIERMGRPSARARVPAPPPPPPPPQPGPQQVSSVEHAAAYSRSTPVVWWGEMPRGSTSSSQAPPMDKQAWSIPVPGFSSPAQDWYSPCLSNQ